MADDDGARNVGKIQEDAWAAEPPEQIGRAHV